MSRHRPLAAPASRETELPEKLLTCQEAAELLRCRPAKLRGLALRGELPYIRLGRPMLFGVGDVADYIAKKRIEIRNR